MLRNRKGFTGIETLIAIAIIGALIGFFGPQTVKSAGTLLNGGDKNQQKQIHKVNESYPVMYRVDDKGNYKPAGAYKKNEEFYNLTAQEPPETLWMKFWHLGAMAVVIIIILGYLGLLPVIRLWYTKIIKPKINAKTAELEVLQNRHAELSAESKRIVISVDAGLESMDNAIKIYKVAAQPALADAVDKVKLDFLHAMSEKQDQSTKDLVKELLKHD